MILRVVLMSLAFFSSSSVNSTVRNDIRSSITHRWTFNGSFPYKDHVTGQKTNLIPRTAQPIKNIDYLHLPSQSALILGSFTDRCLTNMPFCNSGYSLAFWIKITSNATLPQIFLGTARNNFNDLQGVFVYQTETIRTERTVIVEFLFNGSSWKVPLKIQQEIWDFIVATWNSTNGRLAAYLNGELINSSVAGNKSDVSKHVKLRGNFPEQVPRASLYLESGALYDQVTTRNRSLNDYEVKRAFEMQMDGLSKIKCTATSTTLNITWQAIKKNVFKNRIQGYRLTVWRILNETEINRKDLNHSSNHYFLKNLVPYSSYKVRLWDSNVRKRLGGLICGVPSKVRNLTITAHNSTSLLVKWSPPAQRNGILQGYNITLSMMGKTTYKISVTEKYLATDLMADTEFAITVQGFTETGSGPPSRKIAKTNKVPAITEAPKNITAFAVSWHTLEVTWTPLHRKEEVTSYELEYCSFINCSTMQVQGNSVVVKGLTQYTTYRVKLRGRNAQSAGPWNYTDVKTLDLDECSGGHRCSKRASCINTVGSYECRCDSGLSGDGYWCQVAPTGSLGYDFCKEELLRNITWMRTPKGKTIERRCPYGFSGTAFRTCSAEDNTSWQKPDLTKCISKPFKELQLEMESRTMGLVSLANKLSEISKPADNELVVSGNLHAAVDILKSLDQRTTKNVLMSKEEVDSFMKDVVNVADNLLGGKAMEAWQDSPTKSRSDEASKLLTSIENIALMAASVSNSTNTSNVTTSNVVLRFRSFRNKDFMPKIVAFSEMDDGSGSRIEMPASEVPWESTRTDLGRIDYHIAFIYFKNIAQLLTASSASISGKEVKSNTIVNTGVLSLSTNPKISGTFQEPVVITLQHYQSEGRLQPSCVFWKISGYVGLWSREGCNAHFTNSTHTICHCYHLTSFSALMQYTPELHVITGTHELALSLITYIGISISLIALVLALMTFCSFAFLRSNRNFAHTNLVLSLILAELLFVVGIDKTQYETGCFVIAVFLHYLFLVAFCWMATEGVILYLMLVKVLPTSCEGPKKKHFFICSWGIPIIPVVTAIVVDREGYTTDKHCWLSAEDGFIWSFVGPVLLICLVNLGFLGMTFKAMVARSTQQPSRSPPQMRYWAKACAVLTCLLGTTWLLGLFLVGRATAIMAYLFNIFNVLQGLFIFIFHCLADERIRTEYKRIIFCHGSRRDYIRKTTIPRTRHNKSPSTITTRIVEKKARESEEKRISLGDDTVAVETHSFSRVSRVMFADQGLIEDLDHNLEMPSLSKAGEKNADESSETCQDNNVGESDEGEGESHDDESIQSDDAFFEDISSSLINIRKGKVNDTWDSTSKQVSTISNPLEKTLICASDLDYIPYYSQREELSHNNEQNEMKKLPYQGCHGSWRVVNVTNHDSMQQIKEVHVEDENESLDFSADFDLESNYQRQYTFSTRRVYRYSQDSHVLTSTRPTHIAVSESSVTSSDFRMSISTFENGHSELEDDSASVNVFDEEEELATNDKTSDNERFITN